jgi:hypothetical protein
MGRPGAKTAQPRFSFSFYYFCFAILSKFQTLVFKFEFVGEFHTQIKCTIKSANMKEYFYSCIFFFIVYILCLLFLFSFFYTFNILISKFKLVSQFEYKYQKCKNFILRCIFLYLFILLFG